MSIYCPGGSYFKSGNGAIHKVCRGCSLDLNVVDAYSLMCEGILTPPVGFSEVMKHFGVEKSVLNRHGEGPITYESLLRLL